jgi:hypothetical protein
VAAFASIPALDVACPGCGRPIRLAITCTNGPPARPGAVTVVLSIDEDDQRAAIGQHLAEHHPDLAPDGT